MQRIAVEDRRAALLAAAVRVIAERGVAAATTRAIAAEAGMPTASFHYVFASRTAMLTELVGAVLQDQGAAVAASVAGATTLEDFAVRALQAWLDRAVAHPAGEIVLHELLAWSRFAEPDGSTGAAVYAGYERTVAGFVAAARERFGAGWSVPDADVARLVIVHTDGIAARWLVDRDDAAARRMVLLAADAVLALAAGARA